MIRMSASDWQLLRLGAEDPLVEEMVAGYLSELVEVMPDFDPARAAPPTPGDFEWPNGSFLLVVSEHAPIACGALRRLTARTGELRRMWVRPEWRGRGVGRRLLAGLEEMARDMDLSELRLDTHRGLGAALGLYRSSGFRDVPRYNDNEFADFWLAKDL